MLATEPILLLLSLYIALIYGLLYAFFFSFPITFLEDYKFNEGQTGLALISIWIGLIMALMATPFLERSYLNKVRTTGKAEPEDRLIGMMVGAPAVPICKSFLLSTKLRSHTYCSVAAMFIFGWASPPIVMPGGGNWVGPCSSGIPFGFGSK